MTAKIKLNAASGGGSFSIQAPSSSSNNRVFTLPDSADGTIATTATAGKFVSYAIIGDQKAYNSNGGSFTSGAWRTRDLNTEFADEDSIVSISSNQFTLQAGTYFIRTISTAYKTDRSILKLQNITDASLVGVSTTNYLDNGSSLQGEAKLSVRFTISGAKTFELQHYSNNTENTYGFGIAHNIGGFNSIYTIVEIFKEV